MPDTLRELAKLGVEITSSDGAPFCGIRFVNHGSDPEISRVQAVASADFPDGDMLRPNVGFGLRRQRLHTRLEQAAKEAGVHLRWQSPVQRKADGRLLVAGHDMRYRWLVGADGQGSQVRSWTGLNRGRVLTQRFGFRQHFRVEPWSPYVEVHWGRSGQAYVTPVAADEVCVATMTRHPHLRLAALLEELPVLRDRLAGRTSVLPRPIDSERGALTTTRRLARVARGQVALVGDASGSADAITGEGMGMAFRQAILLAECIEADDLARYNRLHPEILWLPQTMARVMLLMDLSAEFRDRALSVLASRPALFARMLGVHIGAEPLARFLAAKGFEVAWRLAMARPEATARLSTFHPEI